MSVAASPSDGLKIDIGASVRAAYSVVIENARLAVDLAWLPFAILVAAELVALMLGGGGFIGLALSSLACLGAYALALRELFLSDSVKVNSLRATLHFLDPNLEISLDAALLEPAVCAPAIDDAMKQIAILDGTLDADQFPPEPATHCRICNFVDLCPAGKDWLRKQ